MSKRRLFVIAASLILSLGMFLPSAQAQRQDFEMTGCVSGTQNMLHGTPEITLLSSESKGILRSTHASKLFDNWAYETRMVMKGHKGKWSWNGFGKMMSPDGEFMLVEIVGDGEKGSTITSIFGTGKWKGAKMEIKSKRITAGKPIVPGTYQSCDNKIGWVEMSK
jgi:hypothetical protein